MISLYIYPTWDKARDYVKANALAMPTAILEWKQVRFCAASKHERATAKSKTRVVRPTEYLMTPTRAGAPPPPFPNT